MKLTEDGMVIDESDIHPLKHHLSMTLTVDGILYDVRLLLGRYVIILFFVLLKMAPSSVMK